MRSRSTFSSRVALAESRIPAEPRELLRRGTGVDFHLDRLSIRAGGVPLFRRDSAGDLRQCLRLALRAATDCGPLRVEAVREGRILDEVSLEAHEGEHVVRLFLPEARRATDVTLQLTRADGSTTQHPVLVEPQRKWRIFLIHHSHLDIGYTDPQPVVLRNHLAYLDSALDFAAASDDWPEDAQFRWNVESNWPLQLWLSARPAAARSELLERSREGRFEVCGLPFTSHTEALSIDELASQLRFADRLRATDGVRVDTVMQTDAPGAVLGLPELLASAGVRYLSVAHNYAGRATPQLTGGDLLPRLFYWVAPSGKRVLVWQTDSPHGVAYLEGNLVGLADSYEQSLSLLPEYLAALANHPYPYGNCAALGLPDDLVTAREPYPHDLLHLRVQGTLADNAAPSLAPAAIVRAWNEQWAFPQLRSATNREFFEAAEERVGGALPSFTGDWTDWWADGLGSAARALGTNRRAQAAIRTAQTLHALADATSGREGRAWSDDADRAYESMALFDEHTWCAAHPDGDAASGRFSGALQWQAKAELAADALRRSEDLAEAATSRLAHALPATPNAVASFVVVNTSSWARTDLASVWVPSSRVALDVALEVVDALTGERVPHAETVRDVQHDRNRPPGRSLSLLAADVPPLGYRRYELVRRASIAPIEGISAEPALENDSFRVELDHHEGAISRLFDKELGLDLVDGLSPFGFGQYVYDRYLGVGRSTIRQAPVASPSYDPADPRRPAGDWVVASRSCPGFGVVTARVSNAVEERVTIRLAAEGTEWLESSFRLARGIKRLDVTHRLQKTPTTEKESVYFTFPFAVPDATVELEVTAGTDLRNRRVPGSAAHMQAVRHWATLANDRAVAAWSTLEAPLVHVGNVFMPFPPYPPTLDETRPGTIVSWAMNNVWDTNFPTSQQGEVAFSYSIASAPGHAPSRVLGMQTAASLTRPLVGILAARTGDGMLAEPVGTFCSVDRGDVEVVAVTASRRGHDLVVLLHSQAAEPADVQLEFPSLAVQRVFTGTFLERDLRELRAGPPARVRIAPGEYLAVALDLAHA